MKLNSLKEYGDLWARGMLRNALRTYKKPPKKKVENRMNKKKIKKKKKRNKQTKERKGEELC